MSRKRRAGRSERNDTITPTPPASEARFAPLAPGVVFVVVTLVALWAIGPYLVGVFHDDGVYALLAQAIASGQGFHYTFLPGAPVAVHYPPLYPLLLALFWRVGAAFPDNVGLLVGLNAPLIGLAAAGWCHYASHVAGWRAWRAAPLAVGANLLLPTLALASALLSETLFLALLWPALVLAERAVASDERRPPVVAGVATGLLMLTRTHGVALLLGLVLVLALERRWRDAVTAAASCVAVQLPWLVWTALARPRVAPPLEGSYGSYLGWFIDGVSTGGASFIGATVRANTRESWLYLGDRFAAGFPTALQLLTVLIVVVALIVGVVRLARRARVTIAFFILYLGIMLVWPYNPWRFVWAVWPVAAFLTLEGVREGWMRGRQWRIAVALAAVLPVVALLRVELHAYALREWRAPGMDATRQIVPVLQWVHANVPPDDMILTEGEQTVALYESRRAAPPISFTAREYLAPPSVSEGAERLTAMLHAVPAKWVILFAPNMIQSAESLRDRHPGLARTEQLPTAMVYRVVP